MPPGPVWGLAPVEARLENGHRLAFDGERVRRLDHSSDEVVLEALGAEPCPCGLVAAAAEEALSRLELLAQLVSTAEPTSRAKDYPARFPNSPPVVRDFVALQLSALRVAELPWDFRTALARVSVAPKDPPPVPAHRSIANAASFLLTDELNAHGFRDFQVRFRYRGDIGMRLNRLGLLIVTVNLDWFTAVAADGHVRQWTLHELARAASG